MKMENSEHDADAQSAGTRKGFVAGLSKLFSGSSNNWNDWEFGLFWCGALALFFLKAGVMYVLVWAALMFIAKMYFYSRK